MASDLLHFLYFLSIFARARSHERGNNTHTHTTFSIVLSLNFSFILFLLYLSMLHWFIGPTFFLLLMTVTVA